MMTPPRAIRNVYIGAAYRVARQGNECRTNGKYHTPHHIENHNNCEQEEKEEEEEEEEAEEREGKRRKGGAVFDVVGHYFSFFFLSVFLPLIPTQKNNVHQSNPSFPSVFLPFSLPLGGKGRSSSWVCFFFSFFFSSFCVVFFIFGEEGMTKSSEKWGGEQDGTVRGRNDDEIVENKQCAGRHE